LVRPDKPRRHCERSGTLAARLARKRAVLSAPVRRPTMSAARIAASFRVSKPEAFASRAATGRFGTSPRCRGMSALCAHRTADVDVKRSSLDSDDGCRVWGISCEYGLNATRRATPTARTAVRWCAAVIVRGPRPCPCLRECALFILVADVHRRVAPIETSLEWLLLFASHQNVIKFEKDARPLLASKPSHQYSNNPCGHCGNRCPKCAADVGAHLLFLARPLNCSFTEPTQGERPLWVRIDARAMTDRVEHSTLSVGFKLGAPRGLLLQVCHGASRKVSTLPQLDDDTLPHQRHSNRSVRGLFQ